MTAIRILFLLALLCACGGSGGGNMTMPDASASDAGPVSSGGALWIAGLSTPFRWDGSAWHPETKGLPLKGSTGSTFDALYDLWVPSSSEAWGIAKAYDTATNTFTSVVLTWKGDAWTEEKSFVGVNLYSIWGTSTTDVWIGGDDGKTTATAPRLFHWDGAAWTSMLNTEAFGVTAIWGRSPTEVYFGLPNAILRYDGVAITRDYYRANVGCDAFWGTTPINILTVCYDSFHDAPMLMQRNGPNSWSTATLSTNLTEFVGLHGRSSTDVWMVGNVSQRAGVLHSDGGAAWTSVPLPDTLAARLLDIWAAPDAVWVVGDAGTVLRRDGASWTAVPIGTTELLRRVRGIE